MRAASAIDLALWDILGQSLGGAGLAALRRQVRIRAADLQHLRRLRPCGATERHALFERNEDWGRTADERSDAGGGPTRISTRSVSEPATRQQPFAEGIGAMKIWPFDVAAEASNGARITGAEIERALQPVRAIREAAARGWRS